MDNQSNVSKVRERLHQARQLIAFVLIIVVAVFGLYRVQTIANQNHSDSAQRVYQACVASNQVRAQVLSLVTDSGGPPVVDPKLQKSDPDLYQYLTEQSTLSQQFIDKTKTKLQPINCVALAGIKHPPPTVGG